MNLAGSKWQKSPAEAAAQRRGEIGEKLRKYGERE